MIPMHGVFVRSVALVALCVVVTQAATQPLLAQSVPENSTIGTLAAYDGKARTLTLKVEKNNQTFLLADKAAIHLGSRVVAEDEIGTLVGRKVKIRYTETDGKRVAHTVVFSRTPQAVCPSAEARPTVP